MLAYYLAAYIFQDLLLVITGKTKLLGVIGHPVEHSLSPVMHNAAIAHLNRDYVYVPLPVSSADLAVAIAGFAAIGVQGFNITIPHKQAILPLLAEVTPVAQAVGAVNTVWRTNNYLWAGTNTDVTGFIAPLKTANRDWQQAVAVILGNGGAARAVVAGCTQLGCAEIHLVGRSQHKLEAFLASWQQSVPVNLHVHSWEKLPELISHTDLLVNTTPIGMQPQVTASPLNDSEIGLLPAGTIAYDLIYTPSPTQFLQQAQQQGAIAIDGLEMLIQQGAAALQIWLQQPAPIDVMRQSLQKHLKSMKGEV